MLVCGPHLPSNTAAAHEMIRKGQQPTAICNNCSGKHAGLIATSLHLKEDPEGYEKNEHLNQVRIRKVLSEVMRIDVNRANFGIDGCGIPTYAVPLQNMAIGMMALINPKESEQRKRASQKILDAIKHEPFYLSGTDTFASEVIAKTEGRCIIKNGAEGVYCGVIPEKGLAFSLKVEDGSSRAAEIATGFILQKMGGLKADEIQKLKPFFQPKVKNWKNLEVGTYRISI